MPSILPRPTGVSLASPLSRRLILVAAASGLGACATTTGGPASGRKPGAFTHGVASGDPFPDSVVLWTRFVAADGGPAVVGWEVAADESFQRVVAWGAETARPDNDFCVKPIAARLAPGRRYFYRFASASGYSPIGRTLTAPQPGDTTDALSVALFACSNLPTGWFTAYGHAAQDDSIDLCAHVGDYFYEYPMSRYGESALTGRVVDDFEPVTLPQYWSRYRSYRADPDLQELHRMKPWVMTWDDHDFTNDSWMGGAQNHQPETEGDWAKRKAAAIKAFRDWTPTRRSSVGGGLIHRTLGWGRLADVIVLDSRMVGRTNQMDWQAALGAHIDKPQTEFTNLARAFYEGPMSDPKRTILGDAQEAWFARELRRSSSGGVRWQVIVQGSVLGAAVMPPNSADANAGGVATLRAKLGAAGLPYDIPLWCGYPEARRRFLAHCTASGSNVLAIGGETHSGWAFNLPGGADGRPACVEAAAFAVAASGKAGGEPVAKGPREDAFRASSPELGWCNLAECGYTRITVTRTAATADWVGFNDLTTRGRSPSSIERTVSEATDKHGASPWTPA
ncbi:alkaline phosphatase [bacterium]|nr:alkaline phosphatase [bacterium]